MVRNDFKKTVKLVTLSIIALNIDMKSSDKSLKGCPPPSPALIVTNLVQDMSVQIQKMA